MPRRGSSKPPAEPVVKPYGCDCSDGGYIKGQNGRRITYDDPVTNETNGVNNCKKN